MIQWLELRVCTVRGTGSIPGQRTKIPHAMWDQQGQKKKKDEVRICQENHEHVSAQEAKRRKCSKKVCHELSQMLVRCRLNDN